MHSLFAAFATVSALASAVVAAPAAASCQSNRFFDAATSACVPCPRTFKTCTSLTVGTSCVRGYYLTTSGTCVSLAGCPSGTYASNAGTTIGTCAKCYSPNYASCSSASTTAALSCIDNYYLTPDKTCVTQSACNALTVLTSSTNPTARAFFPNPSIRRCIDCGANTASCTAKETRCSVGWFWDSRSKTCVAFGRCPANPTVINGTLWPATYANQNYGYCAPCLLAQSYSCDGAGEPTSCLNAYLVFDNNHNSLSCVSAEMCKLNYEGTPTRDREAPNGLGFIGVCENQQTGGF
ncbi:hypothetical protein JCM8097_009198 [Rhodosporidiobolus ruineniae]